MHLQTADIDDSAAAIDKILSLAPLLHHISGIPEAVLIVKPIGNSDITTRCAWRADAQRGVDNFHFDFAAARCSDEADRKALKAVGNVERDAGFGRRIGMGTPPAGLNASFKALRSAWSAISPERRTYCGAISATACRKYA